MFDFVRIQYGFGRIDQSQVEWFSSQGWITTEEAARIVGGE